MKAQYEKKEKPIYVQRKPRVLSLIPHFHKEFEIVYVVKGSTVAFADNNRVEVKKGQIYISFPNQIHYYISSPDSEFRVFIVSANVFFGIEQLLHNNIPQNPLIETEPDEPVHTYCRKITELTENGDVSELTGYFNLLMARILKGVTLGPASLNVSSSLHEVLMFCANHYAEEITLDFVAQQMHLSRHHISHLFGKKLNIGFNDYINSLRIKEAGLKLSLTDEKISDIAGEVGFGSIRTFNRAFLRIMGCTPAEYRKQTK